MLGLLNAHIFGFLKKNVIIYIIYLCHKLLTPIP